MSNQLMRFIVVGGLNTVITLALFHLLSPSMGHLWAYSFVYALGIGFAYLLNTVFVFEVRKSWKSAVFYPLIYVSIYFYGLTMLALLVDYFDFNQLLAVIMVVLSSVPLNFLMTRLLFKRLSGK